MYGEECLKVLFAELSACKSAYFLCCFFVGSSDGLFGRLLIYEADADFRTLLISAGVPVGGIEVLAAIFNLRRDGTNCQSKSCRGSTGRCTFSRGAEDFPGWGEEMSETAGPMRSMSRRFMMCAYKWEVCTQGRSTRKKGFLNKLHKEFLQDHFCPFRNNWRLKIEAKSFCVNRTKEICNFGHFRKMFAPLSGKN